MGVVVALLAAVIALLLFVELVGLSVVWAIVLALLVAVAVLLLVPRLRGL